MVTVVHHLALSNPHFTVWELQVCALIVNNTASFARVQLPVIIVIQLRYGIPSHLFALLTAVVSTTASRAKSLQHLLETIYNV